MNKKWLIDPFHFIAGGQALVLGLILIGVAAVICRFAGVHFDGVIDAHFGAHSSLFITLSEGLINFLLLSVVLTPIAYLIGRPGLRLIDLFGTQALARAPFVLLALVMLFAKDLGLAQVSEQLAQGSHITFSSSIKLFSFSLLTLCISGWAIYLMYRSLAICTHTGGGKTIAGFVIGLLIAEITSKYVLALFYQAVVPLQIA